MTGIRANVEAIARGQRPLPTYDQTMGFRLTSLEEGRAIFEVDVSMDRLANPGDRLHGGVLCGLADSAMGFAYSSVVARGESCTNTDVSIRFLRPIWEGTLVAEARVVKQGRRTGLVECTVTRKHDGKLVARASSGFLTLAAGEAGHSA